MGRLSLLISSLQQGGRAGLVGVSDFGSAPGGLVLASRPPTLVELLRLQGSMQVGDERSSLRTRLQVWAQGSRSMRLAFAPGQGGASDLLASFDVDRTTASDRARISLDMLGRLESDTMGGAVPLSTPRPLVNYIGNYPKPGAGQGQIEIRGAGTTLARIVPDGSTPDREATSYDVRIELDRLSSGGVDAIGSTSWSNVVIGFLWWDEFQPLPYVTTAVEFDAGLRLIQTFQNAEAWPRDEGLRVRWSQPPVPGAQLTARLMDLGLRALVGHGGTGELVEAGRRAVPGHIAVGEAASAASAVAPLPARSVERRRLVPHPPGARAARRHVADDAIPRVFIRHRRHVPPGHRGARGRPRRA